MGQISLPTCAAVTEQNGAAAEVQYCSAVVERPEGESENNVEELEPEEVLRKVVPKDLFEEAVPEEFVVGSGNMNCGFNEEIPLTEMTLDEFSGSEIPDVLSRDMLGMEGGCSQSVGHTQVRAQSPTIGQVPKLSEVTRTVKAEPYDENTDAPASLVGRNAVLNERHHTVSETTAKEVDGEQREQGEEGERKTGQEENVVGKMGRSLARKSLGMPENKLKGNQENGGASSGSKVEGQGGTAQSALKVQDQRHRADWVEPEGTPIFIPPVLERAHQVYTSINTACGYLQREQLEPSWKNVKEALQQLSGASDVLLLDDIQRLAQTCPRMVKLDGMTGEGENTSFNVQLFNHSEPENWNEFGAVGQWSKVKPDEQQISDAEARLIVDSRQKAFQVYIVHLAHLHNNQQLQVSHVESHASENGKQTPSQSATQGRPNNEGHQRMGPAILALPTQNLVLSPPPLLPQHLQPSRYHTLSLPIQLQPYPANGYPQEGTSNYAGYQLSSIPSTSQPPTTALHPAQPNPLPIADSAEPATTSEPVYQPPSGNKGKRRRSPNWDNWEVVLLVQAKKYWWETVAKDQVKSSNDRWKKVENDLKDKGVVERDHNACKKKWESLLSDHRAVKEWNEKAGNASYHSLTAAEKKAVGAGNLPTVFTSTVMGLMDSFCRKPVQASPLSLVDAAERKAPAVGGGAVSGGAVSGRAVSGRAASGGDDSEEEESTEAGLHNHRADGAHGSAGKRRKPNSGYSLLVGAFDRMATTMIDVEKGRDERSERLLALETQKLQLDRSKFELETRKVEIEHEDRRSLVRVLGTLAGAFHRIADKM